MNKPPKLTDTNLKRLTLTALRRLENKLRNEYGRFKDHTLQAGRDKAAKAKYNQSLVSKEIKIRRARGEFR